ncbi:hypothetical protein MAR_030041 [Mya arenaria]|uniref:Uncharacterized protein n=1 Tax=Mya arenaria TaxID=6604 RepID=A0ABY7DI39_MYAAR|nr:hypothetical protein MAR_030041 [Mya arenaria]
MTWCGLQFRSVYGSCWPLSFQNCRTTGLRSVCRPEASTSGRAGAQCHGSVTVTDGLAVCIGSKVSKPWFTVSFLTNLPAEISTTHLTKTLSEGQKSSEVSAIPFVQKSSASACYGSQAQDLGHPDFQSEYCSSSTWFIPPTDFQSKEASTKNNCTTATCPSDYSGPVSWHTTHSAMERIHWRVEPNPHCNPPGENMDITKVVLEKMKTYGVLETAKYLNERNSMKSIKEGENFERFMNKPYELPTPMESTVTTDQGETKHTTNRSSELVIEEKDTINDSLEEKEKSLDYHKKQLKGQPIGKLTGG